MNSEARKLEKRALPQLVSEELLGDIERGEISAGEKLPPESVLAEQFGVSRGDVREALKSLQAQGVVEIVNGVGTVVRTLTSTPLSDYFTFATRLREISLVELLEVRRGLEVEASRLAAVRSSQQELQEMKNLVAGMGASVSNPSAFRGFDAAFHVAIARASKNPMLSHLLEAIRVPLERSIEEGLANWAMLGEVEQVWEYHSEIAEAIVDGSPDRAARAMDRHFEQAMRVMDLDSIYQSEEDRP